VAAANARVIDFANALHSSMSLARVSRIFHLYEILIPSLHIPYALSATISRLTDSFHTKYEIGGYDRGDAYTDGDYDARNPSASGLRVTSPRPKTRAGMHGRALAVFLAAGTLLAGGARAQSVRDQNLALCKGDDVGRKMFGCTALIESGQETPETLAIVFLNRGNALAKNGQFDIAIRDYDQAIKDNPQSAEAFWRRGFALEQKGEFDRAIADYDNALKLDPNNANAFANRGHAHSHKKEFDPAIEDLTQAIKLHANDARTYGLRANAYREKAQYDLAIQDCEQAIKLDPDDAYAYYVRGLARQKRGDKSGGKADIAKAKLLDPKVDQE
jgi:tetratricopeptide (TPR) repeat protein